MADIDKKNLARFAAVPTKLFGMLVCNELSITYHALCFFKVFPIDTTFTTNEDTLLIVSSYLNDELCCL